MEVAARTGGRKGKGYHSGDYVMLVAYPKLFEELSNHLSSDVTIYLIGGENLRIKGVKQATKDCDIVVTNEQSFLIIVEAFKSIGYKSMQEKIRSRSELRIEPSITLKHSTKPTVDIFTTSIARKFYISETIRQRAKVEDFVGSHRLTLGILKNEDIFLLKCVTSRAFDLEDMKNLVRDPEFDWETLWKELEKQDKDTGNHVFEIILENIDDIMERTNIKRPPFYKILLLKTIDEMICRTIRNKRVYKDELIDSLKGNDICASTIANRIEYLRKLRLLKERETIDNRITLLPTKSNVLSYFDLNGYYDTRYLIDHTRLTKNIEILSRKLKLAELHNRIAKEIADIVSCDPGFIDNRVYNLAPAIIYSVVRLYKLPITRRSISITASVSEPSLTRLHLKVLRSVTRHNQTKIKLLS
jgi:hypothetical protein